MQNELSQAEATLLSLYYAGDEGKETLVRLLSTASASDLVNIVLALMKLCDAVISNHEELMRTLGFINGLMEREADQLNIPSLKGALLGIHLAEQVDQRKLCETCALRRGSIPNQCESTLSDVLYTTDENEHFFCHDDIGRDAQPTNACAGYAQLVNHAKESQ